MTSRLTKSNPIRRVIRQQIIRARTTPGKGAFIQVGHGRLWIYAERNFLQLERGYLPGSRAAYLDRIECVGLARYFGDKPQAHRWLQRARDTRVTA